MNNTLESLYWYWLYNIEGIGFESIHKLFKIYETPEQIYHNITSNELDSLKISKKGKDNLINSRNLDIVSKSYNRLLQKGIGVITRADEEYPARLKNIYNPPGVLYVRGKLPVEAVPSIAIVGARDCSNYGKELAMYFARELSKHGVHVISGLARGIDSFAHVGALEFEGSTFGVLGCGIDICYPKENIKLYMDILKLGGILSEYNLGYRPLQGNFPMRNRIISGLADGILLVEAREKSGSLITMELGLEQGKNIYACPGRVFDSLSYGTNHIIQQGGKLVLSPEDILEDYDFHWDKTGRNLKKNNYMLETEEKIVYDILSLMPKHMEDIMNETGIAVNRLSEILFELQMKGVIKQTAGNYFSCHIAKEDRE